MMDNSMENHMDDLLCFNFFIFFLVFFFETSINLYMLGISMCSFIFEEWNLSRQDGDTVWVCGLLLCVGLGSRIQCANRGPHMVCGCMW